MSLRHQAASGVKWTTAATMVTAVAQVLQLIVLARLLSPDDFGLMAMVTVVLGFAQAYTDAGISAAIIHYQNNSPEQLSSLYWLNLFTGALFFGIMWLLIPAIVLFFREPRLTPLLRVTSSVFLIVPLSKQFEVMMQKELRFDVLAKQQIVATVFSTLIAVFAALLHQGVWALLWGQLSLIALRSAMLQVTGWRSYRPTFHFAWRDLKGYISFGLFQMGERSVTFLSQGMDQLLIGRLLGTQSLGYYNFAFNLVVQPYRLVNPAVTKVAFPVFAKVQDDSSRLQRGYLKTVNLLCAANGPVLVGLAAVSFTAIPLIFGSKWSGSVPLVGVLAFVAYLRSAGNPVGSLLLAKGRPDKGFLWNLALLIASVPIVYLGARAGGAIGVAIALLVFQVALQAPAYTYLIRPLIGRCASPTQK